MTLDELIQHLQYLRSDMKLKGDALVYIGLSAERQYLVDDLGCTGEAVFIHPELKEEPMPIQLL